MSIDGLITVYRTDTGEKVRIPPHWMDNPTLAAPFQRTPSSRDTAATSPDTPAPADPVPDLDSTTSTRTTRPGRTTTAQPTETPAAGAKE
ncbi:hypothetical protein [Nocardioides sp. T2.26MG-1]|uniref:hypothetical protein n=1 Tax=Nocardioides sp. T2.26MG-1 TaxID=3041166 RepID=UPI002477AC12|nr:hypothetical protein [Nocardioides sp. T2.26MG-1]CAI9417372.1 hypothetical protein HIDPHFAB_03003 [Nocardioides sp. T2.26MG-1]